MMWGLNTAYSISWRNSKPVDIEFHWPHDDKHIHHFEDPETIIERLNYVRRYYKHKENVNVHHCFNSTDDELRRRRHRGVSFTPTDLTFKNSWLFDDNAFLPTIKNKVVFWRPLFNANSPNAWKEVMDSSSWNKVLDNLSEYNLVELSYRSPISEAMYHIATAEFVVSYDGMWHYIARNLFKPMIVFSTNNVTKFHTPNALMLGRDDGLDFTSKLFKLYKGSTRYQLMVDHSNNYKQKMKEYYNAYR